MFLEEAYKAIPKEHELDPKTYEEAVNYVNANCWVKVVETKLESMQSNQVWELEETSDGIKLVGCKWLYKGKRGEHEKVETFKAMLFAKGFTHK